MDWDLIVMGKSLSAHRVLPPPGCKGLGCSWIWAQWPWWPLTPLLVISVAGTPWSGQPLIIINGPFACDTGSLQNRENAVPLEKKLVTECTSSVFLKLEPALESLMGTDCYVLLPGFLNQWMRARHPTPCQPITYFLFRLFLFLL